MVLHSAAPGTKLSQNLTTLEQVLCHSTNYQSRERQVIKTSQSAADH